MSKIKKICLALFGLGFVITIINTVLFYDSLGTIVRDIAAFVGSLLPAFVIGYIISLFIKDKDSKNLAIFITFAVVQVLSFVGSFV